MRLKQAFLDAADAVGAFDVVRESGWRRSRLLILCYHGVSLRDEHEWNPELYVPPSHLAHRMARLRDEGYDVLRLDEACTRLYAGTLPPRSVAVTFDDGAVDFAVAALPVLEAFRIPATVYVPTYYVDKRLPVFDTALSYVLWRGRSSGADLAALCGAHEPLPVGPAAHLRARALSALRELARVRGMNADEKDGLVAEVAAALQVDYADIRAAGMLQLMDRQTLRDLPSGLIDVQLHTHRHRTPRDEALFAREIADNKLVLRTVLGSGRVLNHFCYPSGEYFGEFLPLLRSQGVEFATTCVPGLASRTSDPLLLPRFIDTAVTPRRMFDAWTSGVADLLPKRRRYRLEPERLATRPTSAT